MIVLNRLRDRFTNLPPRQQFTVVIGFAVLSLVVAVWTCRGFAAAPWRSVEQVWFYDLNSSRFFAAPADAVPPIAAPSGPLPTGEPAGVKVWAFACSDGTVPEDAPVVWLETRHPGAINQSPPALGGRSAYGPVAPIGFLTKQLGDAQWHPGEANFRLMTERAAEVCGEGQTLVLCVP